MNRFLLPQIVKRNFSGGTPTFTNLNIEMSTLANGIRVVTDCTPGHFTALGAYVDGGSRYEDPAKSGLSHIIDRMAWKSTSNYNGIEMMENLSKLGGNYMCSAQRESIIYQASVFNKDVDKMFDCISQTIKEPKFTDQEILETLQTIDYEINEMNYRPDIVLPEVLHGVAYKDNTLGIPLYCPPERLADITKQEIIDYHKKFFQPQNTVISMTGVDHNKAINLVESHLKNWQPVSQERPDPGQPLYSGGEASLPFQKPLFSNLPELYHMQIGFETSGLLNQDLYALATLQKLLGGGSSFSAGGPGKGMFSRLYTRVLNQYPFVENCMSFNHSYMGSGLFGITISATPNAAHVMSQIIAFEFSKLLETKPGEGGISETEFKRAKNQLISSLLMNGESKLAALEDLGRQIQCQNKITSVDEMIEKIQALTINDIQEVTAKLLAGSPSIVMQGDRGAFGDVEFVLQYFNVGKFDEKLTDPRDFSKTSKGKFGKWF